MDGRGEPAAPAVVVGQFHELADFLYGGGDPQVAWRRLVEFAVRAIPGCACAAVTVWADNEPPRSLATSDAVATTADLLQYEHLHGPCLAAASEGTPDIIHICDVATETRWPTFTHALLAETSIRAALSMQLIGPPRHAALNMYASKADTFDDAALAAATLFAGHARLLLMRTGTIDRFGNLQRAQATSRQIGEAISVLMGRCQVSQERAFEMLRERSESASRTLHDVATEIITRSESLPT